MTTPTERRWLLPAAGGALGVVVFGAWGVWAVDMLTMTERELLGDMRGMALAAVPVAGAVLGLLVGLLAARQETRWQTLLPAMVIWGAVWGVLGWVPSGLLGVGAYMEKRSPDGKIIGSRGNEVTGLFEQRSRITNTVASGIALVGAFAGAAAATLTRRWPRALVGAAVGAFAGYNALAWDLVSWGLDDRTPGALLAVYAVGAAMAILAQPPPRRVGDA